MSQDKSAKHRSQAIGIFNEHHTTFSPAEKALFLLGLAQVEALTAVLDKLEDGVTGEGDHKLHDAVLVFSAAANQLSRRR